MVAADWKNKLICGDNLEVLSTLEKESVDLIYIDPPFFSNRNYEVIWNDAAEIRSFEDRWEGGIEVYIDWMRERVRELYRILKPTGSFYLHCDWHAGHYLKVMLDEIFGKGNFRNEIIWHYRTGNVSEKQFQRKHDTIFFYSKSKEWTYHPIEIKEYYTAIYGPKFKPSFKGRKSGVDEGGEYRMSFVDDVWNISAVFTLSKEHFGYPTQKPEALLERIIKASSNKDDIILDAFCGCGTAMAVAQKLGRRWTGIDISPAAISLVKNRLSTLGARNFEIVGMPKNTNDLKELKPNDFQSWVVAEMFGTISPKMSGDLGIDGLSFLQHYPIQVKQSESVGREVIDNFETAIRRYYGNRKEGKGIMVAFSFTKGAHEEVARAKSKEGFDITLLTVKQILERKFNRPQTIAQDVLAF